MTPPTFSEVPKTAPVLHWDLRQIHVALKVLRGLLPGLSDLRQGGHLTADHARILRRLWLQVRPTADRVLTPEE